MSSTATKESAPKTIEGEIATEAPAPSPIALLGEEQRSGRFSDVLLTRIDDIAPLLPSYIKKERFIAAANAAVRQNPDLLDCTQRSLFNALAKAAQDGLLPDGREGVILSYNTKVEHNGKEVRVKEASWSPMAYGLRKRAREIDGIIIDAQVVYDKDTFIWHQGDEPRLDHQPAKLGTDRGPMIGVYAVFKRESGVILHREVMDKHQVMATKNQSKAKTSLMWTTFETEGWRKAAVRRGMKTVPVSEALETIIARDDENYDFSHTAPAETVPSPPSPPPVSPAPKIIAPTPKTSVASIQEVKDPALDLKLELFAELEACETERAVEDLRARGLAILDDDYKEPWKQACAMRYVGASATNRQNPSKSPNSSHGKAARGFPHESGG